MILSKNINNDNHNSKSDVLYENVVNGIKDVMLNRIKSYLKVTILIRILILILILILHTV